MPTLMDSDPWLARFGPLTTDRAALYSLDAGDFSQAAWFYDALLPLVEAMPPSSPERAHNLFTTRLGRAAAEIAKGRPSNALNDLDAARGTPPPAASPAAALAQDILIDGLRAQAYARAKDWDAALSAEAARRDRLERRYRDAQVDDDAYDLATAEGQMADWSWQKKDRAACVAHLEKAFEYADAWSASTGTAVDPLILQLLDAAAHLQLDEGVTLGPRIDLARRLASTQDSLSRLRNPDWAHMRSRITAYLARLRMDNAAGVVASAAGRN